MMTSPIKITRGSSNELKILWNDNEECSYNLRQLRSLCQCAMCRHEITGEQLIKLTDVPENINVLSINVVGNYALQLFWSDNHATGIYSYDYLRELCSMKN